MSPPVDNNVSPAIVPSSKSGASGSRLVDGAAEVRSASRSERVVLRLLVLDDDMALLGSALQGLLASGEILW